LHYRRVRIEGGTYFFTVVTNRRRPIFDDPATVEILHRSISGVQARHPFEIVAQVVLPDHFHTIWTLPLDDADYSKRWRLIKEAVTREFTKVRNAVERSGCRRTHLKQPVWQNRFWEHAIRDDDDLAAHVDYIHLNPVHHGLVKAPKDWSHSTFHAWVERGVYPLDWGSSVLPEWPDWAKRYE
jgi:putative transposase